MSTSSPRSDSQVNWVWTMPNFGETWCKCTPDPLTGQPPHVVTRPMVTHRIVTVLGSVPEQMRNQEISLVVMDLWKFPTITPPIAEALMRSVKAVNGLMADDYPLNTAMAVIKHFSQTWDSKQAR